MDTIPQTPAPASRRLNAIRGGLAALGRHLSKASPGEWIAATLLLLTCFSLFIYTLLAYTVLYEVVHSLGHSGLRLPFLARAFDDGTPLPGLFAIALVAYCWVETALVPLRGARLAQEAWRGSLRAFIYSSALYVAVQLFFWMSLGIGIADGHALVCLVLVAGLLAGIVLAGICFRFSSKKLRLLSFLPPVVTLVAFVYLAGWFAQNDPDVYSVLPDVWPTSAGVGIQLALVLAIGTPAAWAEKRFCGSLSLTAGLLLSALWGLVVLSAYGLLLPFHHLCLKWGPNSAQDLASGCVLGGTALALCVRWVAHRMRGAAPPATQAR